MSQHTSPENTGHSVPVFRVDPSLQRDVTGSSEKPAPPKPRPVPEALPEPVFPQFPELLRSEDKPRPLPAANGDPYQRRWSAPLIYRALRGWLFPYVKSRVLPGDFHPIVAYLFTEWKCNLDCHYCWAFDNRVKGMTEEIAKRSIDWLRSTSCRALALMGGEPLLRPAFVHKVVYYAARKGFWVYVPTNGRLMKPALIDRLADAGMAVVNLAVDVVDEKPGLPKALNAVRSNFEYLVKKQYKYGYIVFFNINICRNNLDDVRQLTEIAHDYGLITDYHLNESPMLEETHFKHLHGNDTFIRPEDWTRVDDTLDWIIDRNVSGYKMVNSIQRLREMKAFMRGKLQEWNCRAGQNNVVIRVDGTLAPCFPMYSATYDWGTIENHKLDVGQLNTMKKGCQPHCFSTLNHNLAFAYNDGRALRWVLRQALRGFQGVSGSIDQPSRI